MNGTIFGMTEEKFADLAVSYGVPMLILFMLFIIANLARESKAGRFGTFVLFLGLAVGFIGYAAKLGIQWWLGIK